MEVRDHPPAVGTGTLLSSLLHPCTEEPDGPAPKHQRELSDPRPMGSCTVSQRMPDRLLQIGSRTPPRAVIRSDLQMAGGCKVFICFSSWFPWAQTPKSQIPTQIPEGTTKVYERFALIAVPSIRSLGPQAKVSQARLGVWGAVPLAGLASAGGGVDSLVCGWWGDFGADPSEGRGTASRTLCHPRRPPCVSFLSALLRCDTRVGSYSQN